MKPVFVGIDPGKSGGIVVLNEDGTIEHCAVMPVVDGGFDFHAWVKHASFLKERYEHEGKSVARLFIEVTFQQIAWVNGEAKVLLHRQAHTFAKVSGAQLAMAYLLAGNAVRLVHAGTWRETVGLVQYGAEDTWKKAAKGACLRLWPQNPKIAKHPGLADAALMALAAKQESTKAKWRRVGR